MSGSRTRRWVSTLKPVVLLETMPDELIDAIKSDDAEWILRWIGQESASAIADLNAFKEQWAEVGARMRRQEAEYQRELHSWYQAWRGTRPQLRYDSEVEWYVGEMQLREERIQKLRDCLRLARDVAGIEPLPVRGVPAAERREEAARDGDPTE